MALRPHSVVALCLDGVVAFDLAVPAQVFGLAHGRRGQPLYRFATCAPAGRRVLTTTGFAIATDAPFSRLHEADTVVVPGYSDVLEPLAPRVVDALAGVVARGGRVISICTGAFALGHAGLLDGRAATTHWLAAAELARLFPAARVDAAVLFVDATPVLTSAGLSAGIDLCLHVVRQDHGAAVGAAVARAMVAQPHRDGGQAQFIERPVVGLVGSLAATRRWALEHLDEPLDIATLAGHAAVSPRTFSRRFVAETGTPPLRWLLAQRVLEARRLLEVTDLAVEDVAQRAGFGTAVSLRQHFRRATATSPTAYRRAFQAGDAVEAA